MGGAIYILSILFIQSIIIPIWALVLFLLIYISQRTRGITPPQPPFANLHAVAAMPEGWCGFFDYTRRRAAGVGDVVVLLVTAAGVWVLLKIAMPYLYGCEMHGLRQTF